MWDTMENKVMILFTVEQKGKIAFPIGKKCILPCIKPFQVLPIHDSMDFG